MQATECSYVVRKKKDGRCENKDIHEKEKKDNFIKSIFHAFVGRRCMIFVYIHSFTLCTVSKHKPYWIFYDE